MPSVRPVMAPVTTPVPPIPRRAVPGPAASRLTCRRPSRLRRYSVQGGSMSTLTSLLADLAEGRVEVIDLTAPLSDRTPVIQLPPPFANTNGFALQEISNYDERGPAWYWNNISAGEHVGTHFDAPVHWISGRDGLDISQVPATQLIGPVVVVDKSAECAQNPDFLLEIEHLEAWQREHGPLPVGGWVIFRTGWDARADDQ